MLVRRIDHDDASELLGLAAAVWALADEPLTVESIAMEMPGADAQLLGEAVERLVAAGWLERSES